ncbi:MAG: hypothetical protein ABIB71_00655 [Candidatus Woesearchaeota archaeon]
MEQKMPYRCHNCNFNFEKEPSKAQDLCPYCGKKGDVKPEITAQELLDDSN